MQTHRRSASREEPRSTVPALQQRKCVGLLAHGACPAVLVWRLQMPVRGAGSDTSPDTTVSDDVKVNFAPRPVDAMSKDPHKL
jgi:hypothetical protein